MGQFTDFMQMITQESIAVPTWEVLILLAVVTLCLLIRGSRLSLLITYIFTLHITWSFMKLHFGYATLITFAVLALIVLILGFFTLLTEQDK